MKKYVNTNFKNFVQERLNEKKKVSILPSTKPKKEEEIEDLDEEPIEDTEEEKDDKDEVDEMIKEYNKLYGQYEKLKIRNQR